MDDKSTQLRMKRGKVTFLRCLPVLLLPLGVAVEKANFAQQDLQLSAPQRKDANSTQLPNDNGGACFLKAANGRCGSFLLYLWIQ